MNGCCRTVVVDTRGLYLPYMQRQFGPEKKKQRSLPEAVKMLQSFERAVGCSLLGSTSMSLDHSLYSMTSKGTKVVPPEQQFNKAIVNAA